MGEVGARVSAAALFTLDGRCDDGRRHVQEVAQLPVPGDYRTVTVGPEHAPLCAVPWMTSQ